MKLLKSVLVVAALVIPVINIAGAADSASEKFGKVATLKVNGWNGEASINFPSDQDIKLSPASVELDFQGTKVGNEDTKASIVPRRDGVKFTLPEALKAAVKTQGELVATVKFQLKTGDKPIEFQVRAEITSKGFIASTSDILVNVPSVDGSGSSHTDSTPPSDLKIKEYLLTQIADAKTIEYFDDTPEKTVALFHDLFDELAKDADAAAALPSVEEKQKAWLALNAKLRERMDEVYAHNVGVRTAWRPVLLRVQAKFYEGKDTKRLPLTVVAAALHEIAEGFGELTEKYKDKKDKLAAANKALLGTNSGSATSTVNNGKNPKSSRTSCFKLLLGL